MIKFNLVNHVAVINPQPLVVQLEPRWQLAGKLTEVKVSPGSDINGHRQDRLSAPIPVRDEVDLDLLLFLLFLSRCRDRRRRRSGRLLGVRRFGSRRIDRLLRCRHRCYWCCYFTVGIRRYHRRNFLTRSRRCSRQSRVSSCRDR